MWSVAVGLSLTHPQVQPERDYHLYKVIFPLQDYYGFFLKSIERERGCYNSSAVGEMKIVYQPNYVGLPWKSIPKGVRNGMSSFRGNAGGDLSAARWLCALSQYSPGIFQGWGRQKKSLIPLAQEIGMGTKEMLRRCWGLLGLRM